MLEKVLLQTIVNNLNMNNKLLIKLHLKNNMNIKNILSVLKMWLLQNQNNMIIIKILLTKTSTIYHRS